MATTVGWKNYPHQRLPWVIDVYLARASQRLWCHAHRSMRGGRGCRDHHDERVLTLFVPGPSWLCYLRDSSAGTDGASTCRQSQLQNIRSCSHVLNSEQRTLGRFQSSAGANYPCDTPENSTRPSPLAVLEAMDFSRRLDVFESFGNSRFSGLRLGNVAGSQTRGM